MKKAFVDLCRVAAEDADIDVVTGGFQRAQAPRKHKLSAPEHSAQPKSRRVTKPGRIIAQSGV